MKSFQVGETVESRVSWIIEYMCSIFKLQIPIRLYSEVGLIEVMNTYKTVFSTGSIARASGMNSNSSSQIKIIEK